MRAAGRKKATDLKASERRRKTDLMKLAFNHRKVPVSLTLTKLKKWGLFLEKVSLLTGSNNR